MTVLNWDFTKLSTVQYETNRFEINEDYENISLRTKTADVVFVPSEGAETTVVCYEQQDLKHRVSVQNGTLTVEIEDTRKWYEYIDINFDTPKITVSVPAGKYGSLSVKSSTGRVEIPKEYTFESIDIEATTGGVTNNASAEGNVKIKTSTGYIRVENIAAGALDLSVSTGNITLSQVVCAGDVTVGLSTGKSTLTDLRCKNLTSTGKTGSTALKNVLVTETMSVTRTTGDVTFDRCDAAEILVETGTGDVSGTLLTNKVFITKTTTGNIDVPKSTVGGTCEITTTTGDIELTIVP